MKCIQEGTEFLDQLKDSVHDLYDENKELKKEIERLNNIINELEKYVIENSFGSPLHNTCVIELSKVLDKIKELKGTYK